MAISEALAAEPAVIDPDEFARRGYPHELWSRLRAEAPVLRVVPVVEDINERIK